jgi:superfamily II DNA helicase RecQ
VQQWDHHRLQVFGIGADLDETTWRSVFRQLVALGFARVDHAGYGALKLAEAARPVLKGESRVDLRRARPQRRARRATARRARAPTTSTPICSHALRAWRLSEARTQAVPAYVILHDRTLAEIAALRPRDLAAPRRHRRHRRRASSSATARADRAGQRSEGRLAPRAASRRERTARGRATALVLQAIDRAIAAGDAHRLRPDAVARCR